MAAKTEKTAEPVVEEKKISGEDYVDFQIPFGGENKPVFIGVNGETIRVMPGVTVSVKRKFVEAYENAQAQERVAWETQIRAQNASKRALADL